MKIVAVVVFIIIALLVLIPKRKRIDMLKSMLKRNWSVAFYMILYLFFAAITMGVWQWIEIIEYGKIMPSIADSLFGVMLCLSLLLNIAMYRFLKYKTL